MPMEFSEFVFFVIVSTLVTVAIWAACHVAKRPMNRKQVMFTWITLVAASTIYLLFRFF